MRAMFSACVYEKAFGAWWVDADNSEFLYKVEIEAWLSESDYDMYGIYYYIKNHIVAADHASTM